MSEESESGYVSNCRLLNRRSATINIDAAFVRALEEELAGAKQELNAANERFAEQCDEEEEIKYTLSRTQEEMKEAKRSIARHAQEIFDLKRLLAKVAGLLIAREQHIGEGTTEEQLAETQHFISGLGGEIKDTLHGAEEWERQRNRVNQ
jgi:flagellar biosynthesis chaperone FliJ